MFKKVVNQVNKIGDFFLQSKSYLLLHIHEDESNSFLVQKDVKTHLFAKAYPQPRFLFSSCSFSVALTPAVSLDK